MANPRERLITCFSTVFPELTHEEIEQSSVTSIAVWDSLATMTLVAVLQEEFKTEFTVDEIGQLISFELILDILENKNVGS